MNKNKTILASVIASSLLLPLCANADISVGVGFGYSQLDIGSQAAREEKQLRLGIEKLNRDGRVDLGARAARTFFAEFDEVKVTLDATELVGRIGLTDHGDLLLNAGVGLMTFSQDLVHPTLGITQKSKMNKASYQWGIGYRHHFGRISVQADFLRATTMMTRYDADLSIMTLGANYRF